MKRTLKTLMVFIVIIAVVLSGCGTKNTYFDYMKDGNVDKIIIKNARDKGLRFIITDAEKINNLYKVLEVAENTTSKTSLETDYIIELYNAADIVDTLNYVVGISSSEDGNLFNENNSFKVSKRLDEDIFSYLEDIRKPKYFNKVYYESITKVVDTYNRSNSNSSVISFNITDDDDVQKFIYSTELKNFTNQMSGKLNVVKDDASMGNLKLTFETIGYKSSTEDNALKATFKAKATIKAVDTGIITNYWISNIYSGNSWNYNITTEEPSDF